MKNSLLLFLFFCFTYSYGAIVDTLTVYSKSMDKGVKNVIVLPESYKEDKIKYYPTLYLLHGANGSYKTWITSFPTIKKYADKYNIILVCPDGGVTSWYIDSPLDRKYQYETYVSIELLNTIDTKYRTIKNRNSRAIMGFSMGGYGAISLSLKYPDIWSIAMSSSGGLDLRPFPSKWDIAKRIGSIDKFPQNWEDNSAINMIKLYDKNLPIELFVDCGTEDFFYNINKEFHQKLISKSISHTYMERSGGHKQKYWAESLPYQFVFLEKYLKGIETSNIK